jgi:hypothetical protein
MQAMLLVTRVVRQQLPALMQLLRQWLVTKRHASVLTELAAAAVGVQT